tara:strand:- start:2866 stop:3480 length:615 start_codon:yes stop_codon:yes gene_type:complete
MNYIIEDNINFFDLLKTPPKDNLNNVCLISGSELDNNHITLNCSHKFNYIPLYNEIKQQKKTNVNKLKHYQIICPYCRKIINNLIPFIPLYKNVKKISGVNTPKDYCMKCNDCEWIFKSGKQKNKRCNNSAFNSKFGLLCETHWKHKLNISNKNNFINKIVWNEKLEKLYNQNTVNSLKNLLKEKKLKTTGNKKELVYRLYINN